jgi:Zn-finger nucleic acid-binding protein
MNTSMNFSCPRGCGVELRLAERHGVEIDYCPQCRGVWLDRGELDKIIDRATELAAPAMAQPGVPSIPQSPYAARPPVDRYDDDDDDYRRHGHKKRKKNWLGEMFDFD